jgi:cell division protein FtsX
MDFVYNLLPHLLNGLALGLLFALVALGFMLIIGVMEVSTSRTARCSRLAPMSRWCS